jgi:hypothetical protein
MPKAPRSLVRFTTLRLLKPGARFSLSGYETYMNTLVPMVVEQTNRGERAYDIFSRPVSRRRHSLTLASP